VGPENRDFFGPIPIGLLNRVGAANITLSLKTHHFLLLVQLTVSHKYIFAANTNLGNVLIGSACFAFS
jgi:hypothetical protein